jgi:hypothetical protein
MTAVARKDDEVQSPTGIGNRCVSPVKTKVDAVNSHSVFANSKLIPVKGNKIAAHNKKGCTPDESLLDKVSPDVYIGNKQIGRVGDEYGTGTDEANVITKGSSDVFANG